MTGSDGTAGPDGVERRVLSAFDDVRRLDPSEPPPVAVIEARARDRASARRTLAGVTFVLLLVGGVAVVTGAMPDGVSVSAVGSARGEPALTVPPSTTQVLPGGETAPPTTATERPAGEATPAASVAPAIEPEETATSTPPPTTETTMRPWNGPPDAYAASKRGQVQAATGSSCWHRGGEGQAALCADVAAGWEDDAPVLEVAAEDAVLFRWDIDAQPKEVRSSVFERRDGSTDPDTRRDVECTGGNPCRLLLRLSPGEYVLTVWSQWVSGDVSHAVRLRVA